MRKLVFSRIWSIFFAGILLRVLPERIKGQHRAGHALMWLSTFPKGVLKWTPR